MRTILNSGSLFGVCELAHTLGIIGVSVGQFSNILSIPLCPIRPSSRRSAQSVMDITIYTLNFPPYLGAMNWTRPRPPVIRSPHVGRSLPHNAVERTASAGSTGRVSAPAILSSSRQIIYRQHPLRVCPKEL